MCQEIQFEVTINIFSTVTTVGYACAFNLRTWEAEAGRCLPKRHHRQHTSSLCTVARSPQQNTPGNHLALCHTKLSLRLWGHHAPKRSLWPHWLPSSLSGSTRLRCEVLPAHVTRLVPQMAALLTRWPGLRGLQLPKFFGDEFAAEGAARRWGAGPEEAIHRGVPPKGVYVPSSLSTG